MKLLVERLTSGVFSASVFEFPDCRVEAETREEAIMQIKTVFLERLKNISKQFRGTCQFRQMNLPGCDLQVSLKTIQILGKS